MSTKNDDRRTTVIPSGYVAVPLQEHAGPGLLPICVLAKTDDGGGGTAVMLRQVLTGRVFLGAIVDADERVVEWIELWVQNVDDANAAPSGTASAMTNAVIDRHWRTMMDAVGGLPTPEALATGWDREHPPLLTLDVAGRRMQPAVDGESGHVLQLCTDEERLSRAGLPSYLASSHRYLHDPEAGADAPLVPVTTGAPENDATGVMVTGAGPLLNPGCGLIQARRFHPISYGAFADVLGGASWSGVWQGTTDLPLGEPLRGLSQASTSERLAEGNLVLGRGGQAGRLLEVLHLKVRILLDAIRATAALLRVTQQPLLSLHEDAFRVRLGEPGAGLPHLWTSRAVLVDAGDAVPLPIEGTDVRYFLRAHGDRASIYQPASGRQAARGRVGLRMREVQTADGQVIIEGTMTTSERIETEPSDLVWLRVEAGGTTVGVFGHLDREAALAAGEVRFRSLAQHLDAETTARVKSLEGVPIDGVPFEVVPMLSSACDLYALGVLAVRTLLVGPSFSLPAALDETLSLARRLAEGHDPGVALEARIAHAFETDERWLSALGPHRLVHEDLEPADALGLIPASLWFQTLAMVVPMFPGVGPDSVCRDLGHGGGAGLHHVFDRVIPDAETLLVRSRSLLVVDWAANREIHAVIRRCASGLVGAVPS